MKLILAFASAAVAIATPTIINTKYGSAPNGQCVSSAGYSFLGFNGAVGFPSPNSFPVSSGSNCAIAVNDGVTIACADGYEPTSATTGVSAINGNTTVISGLPASYSSPYDVTTDTSFTCSLIGCNYTCQSANNTASACAASSGFLTPGETSVSVCSSGYYPMTLLSCPAGGSTSSTLIVCARDAALCPSAFLSEFLACAAAIGGAFSVPGSCWCDAGTEVTCPAVNENSPSCSGCNLPCPPAGTTAIRSARQLTAASAAICPPSVNTLAEAHDCFEQAACAGALNPKTDACIYGNGVGCNGGECPECPSSSKKSLLGLLGLLGLIPLLLLSLLCSLLICCIRRRKADRDVHLATFDTGAPPLEAPVCADIPVMDHHHHMAPPPDHHHHATMGPVAGPYAGGMHGY
eukprot:TRINITY_DN14235_c0_g1_i1.p1 TRINITY_DN14235_c0_g1~~TRINITY_DN14235_c0_g1_i1.p1  ORF type:complete len:406 (-),score=71.69 TRINITY_DN14235_c0_g1_i1:237-1454(-)